ncbi:MAG: hypothetical protein OEW12_06835 [Deltaproteobacteria bacterium]|nr:hypothetical protein [Deltaproteobacteria bacterium]
MTNINGKKQWMPSLEELRERYKEVMENQDVTRLAQWTEPNMDEPFDEETYVRNAQQKAPGYFQKIDEVLKEIGGK